MVLLWNDALTIKQSGSLMFLKLIQTIGYDLTGDEIVAFGKFNS